MKSTLRCILILLSVPCFVTETSAQWEAPFPRPDFLSIYTTAKEKLRVDPVIANGIFYENPYMNAIGHPFYGEDVNYDGTVIFRGKVYKDVKLKYELFDQELIFFRGRDRALESIVLTKDFVSEFSILNRNFKKLTFNDNTQQYFEVIAETDRISSCYLWYKTRNETHNDKNFRIFSFSEQKHKDYLLIDSVFYRYKNNRSFLNILPEGIRGEVQNYLRTEKISVKKCVAYDLQNLIFFIDELMHQKSVR